MIEKMTHTQMQVRYAAGIERSILAPLNDRWVPLKSGEVFCHLCGFTRQLGDGCFCKVRRS